MKQAKDIIYQGLSKLQLSDKELKRVIESDLEAQKEPKAELVIAKGGLGEQAVDACDSYFDKVGHTSEEVLEDPSILYKNNQRDV